MKAMILAAGFGTRLFPLTIDRTKPAIPFLGKPLVGYVAEYIAKFGFQDVVVNLHHQPESVQNALGDGSEFGVRINYTLEEPNILGTAGALDNARHLLENDTFLIINGKIITDIDINAALETHRKTGALATMVLLPNANYERFSIVETEADRIKGFGDFADKSMMNSRNGQVPMMFTGIHILEPRVFDYIPRGKYSDIVPTFYNPALRNGEKIIAHFANGNWSEVSTIPRYLSVSLKMNGLENGKNIIGKNPRISSKANIKETVIWDDVTIGENTSISRSVIGDGVTINAGESFENVAIVKAEMVKNCDEIPQKALQGKFIGENYVVALKQKKTALP